MTQSILRFLTPTQLDGPANLQRALQQRNTINEGRRQERNAQHKEARLEKARERYFASFDEQGRPAPEASPGFEGPPKPEHAGADSGSLLQMIAPGEFLQFEQFRQKSGKLGRNQALAEAQGQIQNNEQILRSGQRIQDVSRQPGFDTLTPELQRQAIENVRQQEDQRLGVLGLQTFGPGAGADPEALSQGMNRIRSQQQSSRQILSRNGVALPADPKTPAQSELLREADIFRTANPVGGRTQSQQRVIEEHGPELAAQVEARRAALAANKRAVAREGRAPVPKTAEKDLFQDIKVARALSPILKRMQSANPNLFTFQSRFAGGAASLASKFGIRPEIAARLIKERSLLEADAVDTASGLLKLRSGAVVTDGERKWLVAILPNIKDMPIEQFKVVVDRLVRITERAESFATEALGAGSVSTQPQPVERTQQRNDVDAALDALGG